MSVSPRGLAERAVDERVARRSAAGGGARSVPRARPSRLVIEDVRPVVDGGRFAAKAVAGDLVHFEADVLVDGHDHAHAILRVLSGSIWTEHPMAAIGNDRFACDVELSEVGRTEFEIEAWIDRARDLLQALVVKEHAGQDVTLERTELGDYVGQASKAADGPVAERLATLAVRLGEEPTPAEDELPEDLLTLASRLMEGERGATSERYAIVVDRLLARYSNWYELFPRSAGTGGLPGTLTDVIAHLDYVERLGANVLYLPPIHPIGTTNRKGPNNARDAAPSDPGSPWAIGAAAGGHTAILPELGDLKTFDALVIEARERGIEVAMDFALQCSPDHPWVTEHPSWFRHRPDGTIAYAENPPKRYEDVYPIDFDTADWRALWKAIAEVLDFWIDHGVRVFRVDNPHTKPFALWEWLIGRTHRRHPEVIFLAEAFTRPKVMYRLAKLGFSQSYTYFTWRSERWELQEYLRELTSEPVAQFFRPNFWPNTPDILTAELQQGGRPAFALRALLAATLAASWGIYGPVFELGVNVAREPGSEEYLGSDKYAVNSYDLGDPRSLAPLVSLLNEARAKHPALQRNDTLRFHRSTNEQLFVYSKSPAPNDPDAATILVVVNLDPRWPQSGFVELDLGALGLVEDEPFFVRDLIGGETFRWRGRSNYVLLDPASAPGHLLVLERPHQVTGSNREEPGA